MTSSNPVRNARQTFGTKAQMLALPVPAPPETAVDYPHATQAGLFIRVSPADREGRVRRTYFHRWKLKVTNAMGVSKEESGRDNLGLAAAFDKGDAVITVEEAVRKVSKARSERREAKLEGSPIKRLTVAEAWKFYAVEKQINRPPTHTKNTNLYERYFAYLGDQYLDALNYSFWSTWITQLKDGTLVGSLDDGATSPTLGPLAKASRIGVINLGVTLYEIAHRRDGLKGMVKGANPAREAKTLIGAPNVRRTHIKLSQLGLAWAASDQLCSPWWRDQFRVYVLTGLRHSLLAHMSFSEIDWANGFYVFSPHKKGTKRRGAKTPENAPMIRLPLSKMALDILRARRRFATDQNGPVWFAARPTRGRKAKKSPVLSDPRASWQLIEDEMKLHFTPQDLRRTFASIGAAGVTDLFAVSLLMLHSSSSLAHATGIPAITVNYMDTDEAIDRMRVATEQLAAHVEKLIHLSDEEAARIVEPELPPEIEEALFAGGESSDDYET